MACLKGVDVVILETLLLIPSLWLSLVTPPSAVHACLISDDSMLYKVLH